jgi:phosphocarrier protein
MGVDSPHVLRKVIMKKDILIQSTSGIHAALASKIVQLSHKYDAEVKLYYKDKVIDIASILGLMSLVIPQGENITLTAEGKDAQIVIHSIEELLSR